MKRSLTVVFDCTESKLEGNPFKVESPYGIPYSVSIGDAVSREDILREALEEITELDPDDDVAAIADRALGKIQAMFQAELPAGLLERARVKALAAQEKLA